MRRALVGVLAVPLLAACGATSNNAELVSIDNSSNVDPTPNFAPQAAWDLTYSFDCAEQQSEGTAGANRIELDVINSDDESLDSEHPTVVVKGRSGGSTLHFHRGGTFRVKVVTPCNWRVAVDEVTA